MISGLAITLAIELARARVADLAATIDALEQELQPLRQLLADRADGLEPITEKGKEGGPMSSRTVTPGQGRAGGESMEPIRPGTLVLEADGYYGIVLVVYRNGAVLLFLGNGLTVLVPGHTLTPLGLKIGDPANSPASFHEIIFPGERGER